MRGLAPLALSMLIAAAAAPAHAATTYPQSSGASGPCSFAGATTINTDTGTGIPGFGATEPATPTTPALRVAHCTTLTIQPGAIVTVTGSRALDLRAQGAVQIDGILRLIGAAQAPGAGGGAGGPGGGNPTPSGGGSGLGPGGGNGGGVGSAGSGGPGGPAGPAYNGGGSPGSNGDPALLADFGGGGGGAGSGGGFSAGSGGGGGGSSTAGADGGAGGGGGGAVRIVTPSSITVGAAGRIETEGGDGSPAQNTAPTGGDGGGGSGGSQLLIAPTVTVDGGGALSATGGNGDASLAPNVAAGGDGADGGIRVFSNTFTNSGTSTPAPVQSRYSDWVTVFVTGAGTVTSSPPGINCALDCIEEFDPGTAVTLTATATSPSIFSSWLGDCAGQAGPQCTLTMGAVRTATASFANPPTTAAPSPPPPATRKKKCKKKKRKRGASAAKKCKRKKRR